MSDLFEILACELNKNNVSIEIHRVASPNLLAIGENIVLDFSEHDKVFEDKIAELKKDYKTASELLGKYQQENEALKKRIQELDTIDSIRIDEKRELKQRISELEIKNKQLKHGIDKMAEKSKWIDRAVEWQQKCEKLESKETEKPTKYTTVIVAKEINGQTYVTLDDFTFVVNALQAQIGT